MPVVTTNFLFSLVPIGSATMGVIAKMQATDFTTIWGWIESGGLILVGFLLSWLLYKKLQSNEAELKDELRKRAERAEKEAKESGEREEEWKMKYIDELARRKNS